ncbi:unnamed protein product [Euphydryas editha]|uniref:Uncharacterized protein n=1 Tax=Euphydryas editha TaxID=104508 RepID=A0AAU9U7W9_EUPED|nr:unnamed protein product [Euphydryas editha]
MWKWFMLFWLAPLRTLLTQPVVNENIRSSRQLNFDECCPCHDAIDHDVLSSAMEKAVTADSCPCSSAPDSESASSIFTPALRAVEPFIRSAKEKKPKPLLNPEVGLASSVLETLREVTDQEYQEALVRDAARNERKDMDQSLLDQESTLNTPKNIVNIILQSKQEDIYDAMPEASHAQETRCIHPTKKSSNSFDYGNLKLTNKPFRHFFPLTSAKNSKTYLDMANSASNVQEHATTPLKNNLLEDLKTKSDLLKMKLFSNTKNSLKEANSYFDKSNKFNRRPDYDNYSNNRPMQIPNFKLASIFDLINASKQKNISPSPSTDKEIDKNEENDFMFSPSHHQSYYIRNNERSAENNVNPIHEKDAQKSDTYLKERSTNEESLASQKYDMMDLGNLTPTPLMETNLRNDNDLIAHADIIDKNNYDIFGNDKNFKNKINDNYNENMDAVSSPSEINIVNEPLDKIIESENYSNNECVISDGISTAVNKNLTDDIQKQNLINETEPETLDESVTTEVSEMITTNVQGNDRINESNEENSCNIEDLETGSSNDNLQKTNTQQENDDDEKGRLSEPNSRENQLLNTENSLITTTDKVVNNDHYRTNRKNTLTNIKNDIFKTLENVKKVNENIHEKLKSDVQNALKLDFIKNNSYDNVELTTLSAPTNSKEKNIKVDDDLNTEDLQEMSNRLLNLSLSDNEAQGIHSQGVISTIRNTGNNISPLELNNTRMSTTSLFQLTESTPKLGASFENGDQIVDVASETSNRKENKNTHIIECQNIGTENLGQTEVSLPIDREKEMISEASSPIVNSIPYTNENFIVQPNDARENQKQNVREFLDNFKSSVSDIFNNNRDINRNGVNNNEQPFSESRNIDKYKSFSNKLTGNNLSVPNQISNLNTYKARVPTPDSLKIKTMPWFLNREESTLQQTLRNIPGIRSENNGLRNPFEKPSFTQSKTFNNNAQNDYSPGLNLQNSHLTSFSENLKSRTDEALKNIQDSFDDFHNSHIRNQNNILEKIPLKLNGFRTSQSNDLNKRLEDFNSDVMNRLSLMSQRIQDASILPSHESPIFQTKNIFNNNDRLKPISKTKSQAKNNILLKSNQNTGLKQKTPQSTISLGKKNGISKPSHTMGSLRNIDDVPKFKSVFETKTPLKKDYIRKPLKENKVRFTITTTTVRPDVIKPRLNSKILNKSIPATLRSSINLPKTSTPLKSPLQKRLELMSKLKPFELQPLASDRFSSRVALPDRKIGNSKLLSSSGLEESMIQPVEDLSEDTLKSGRFSMKNDPVGYALDNIGISKLRDAVKIKSSNDNINRNFMDSSINNLKSNAMSDASQSASNNMNTAVSSFKEKPLKENVSYKCKMICFEDDENSTSQINGL